MVRKKQQSNGSGTVYPRKNKDGKITSYLGQYFGLDGKRRYESAKTRLGAARSYVRQWGTLTKARCTTPEPPRLASTSMRG